MKPRARFVSVLLSLGIASCQSETAGPDPNAPIDPSLQTAQDDVTPPVLTALSFSPTAINTTSAAAAVTISFTVTDDLSGASFLCAQFLSPSGTQGASDCTGFPPSTSHSGAIQLTIPQFTESGIYKLSIYGMHDAVGNDNAYSTAALAAAGFPTDLDVTSVPDNTAPVLTALSFSPTAINTTSAAAAVTISYTVTDDLSGASFLCAQFLSPSGTQGQSDCSGFPPSISHSGTIQLTIPQFSEPGIYKLSIYGIHDAVGNSNAYPTPALTAAGFPTDLDVTSVPDNSAPTLTALSFSPTVIHITGGPAVVTISFTVTDDLSGASFLCGQFISPTGTQGQSDCTSFAPSTSHSGALQLTFPQFGESGIYKLSIYGIHDAVGNNNAYTTADLAAAGFPTDLHVNPTAPVSLYLHGSGAPANPPTLFLDNVPPPGTTVKYKDSPSINFAGGNAWKDVGTWSAGPTALSGTITSLGDVHLWLGLKNSDDVGTRFDVRIEARKNGTLFAAGETLCVQNVVRNPNNAKEVNVGFAPFSPQSFNGTSDAVSLRILTRVGTNGSGGSCGGHGNAAGLRTYFDASTRPAGFEATF